MPLKVGDICENCRKHIYQRGQCGDTPCQKCLPPGQLLKTCSNCRFIRYCSKTCQKGDWAIHKIGCRVACNIQDMQKQLSAETRANYKSFVEWCTDTGPFSHAAISALGLHSDMKRIDDYAFLVDVATTSTMTRHKLIDDGEKVQFIFRFTHAIQSARCASMEETHTMLDWRFTAGAQATEMTLAHRPGLMRIYFTNKAFPFPLDGYTTPIDIGPAIIVDIPYDPNWLATLRSRKDMPIPPGIQGSYEELMSRICA
ncbi:unnamed protein product [Cyclocybe aegerita]|uniref:MYND-type domain-containing protein n=1 Tax=Cyclocybe aegerita TaxID=1973307 RepID=A0A8S0WY86_CYCAE|nr:unnamed protein product [Cyclocybe aegerita]